MTARHDARRRGDDSRTVAVPIMAGPQEPSSPFDELPELTPEQFKTLFAFALFTQPISGEELPVPQNNQTGSARK